MCHCAMCDSLAQSQVHDDFGPFGFFEVKPTRHASATDTRKFNLARYETESRVTIVAARRAERLA